MPRKRVTEPRIRENMTIAWIASKILNEKQAAVVINNTIYLHGVSKDNFVRNPKWVLHEMKHIEQYCREGVMLFLLKYAYYSLRYGYENNPYEIEARQAEGNTICK